MGLVCKQSAIDFLLPQLTEDDSITIRTYAKTLYIAHDNFDELHYSHVRSPNYFYSKTFSFSSQITFILIEGCFNWSVRYFDNNPCLT